MLSLTPIKAPYTNYINGNTSCKISLTLFCLDLCFCLLRFIVFTLGIFAVDVSSELLLSLFLFLSDDASNSTFDVPWPQLCQETRS